MEERPVAVTESLGKEETSERPALERLRRLASMVTRFLEGEGPPDTSGYYVTSSQWAPGVPEELELPPDIVSKELDAAFDQYYDAAMASLRTVDPEAPLPERPTSQPVEGRHGSAG